MSSSGDSAIACVGEGRQIDEPGHDRHLRFANKELLGLFRTVPWMSSQNDPVARQLWRSNAPRMVGEASLNKPYMVTLASEFGSVFEFFLHLDEVGNFFSEACLSGDDGLLLGDPGEEFIFAKRSALLRIGVRLA